MTHTHVRQNKTRLYYNAVLGIMLLVIVCLSLRPDTIQQSGIGWVIYVMAFFALVGQRDGQQMTEHLPAYGRHVLHVLLFFGCVEFATSYIDYSQSEDVALSVLLDYLTAHAMRIYTTLDVLLVVGTAYVVGVSVGGVRRKLAGDVAEEEVHSGGPVLLIFEVLGILGRHPVLTLALYRVHVYYGFLWDGALAGVEMLLQCLYLPIFICAILRLIQICGIELNTADEDLIGSIGDLYRRNLRIVNGWFYVATALMLGVTLLNATMFKRTISNVFFNTGWAVLNNALLLVALLRQWNDKGRHTAFFQYGILSVGVMVWYLSGSVHMLVLLLLIVAAEGMSSRRVEQIFLIESVVILTVAAWASVNGYIYYYSKNGLHAMGILQRTDYAAYWFYIFLVYRVLRDKRMRLIEYIVAVGVLAYVDHLAAGRTSRLCGMIFLVACFLIDYWPQAWKGRLLNRILYRAGYLIYPLCAIVSYVVVAIFGPQLAVEGFGDNSYWYTMKARVLLSYDGFMAYPPRMLAQTMNKTNIGYFDKIANDYYFTLDNSYVRYLINYGILFLLIIIAINICLIYRCERENNMFYLCALAVIAIHSISEPHMANIFHNILLVLVFANWNMAEKQGTERITDEATWHTDN